MLDKEFLPAERVKPDGEFIRIAGNGVETEIAKVIFEKIDRHFLKLVSNAGSIDHLNDDYFEALKR